MLSAFFSSLNRYKNSSVDDNDSTGVFIANVLIVETPHPINSTWMLFHSTTAGICRLYITMKNKIHRMHKIMESVHEKALI